MSTVSVTKEVSFDTGHRVPNHKSKCRNPHGHRYRVVLEVTGEINTTPGRSDEGMVLDFGDLKTILEKHVHDVYDHGFVIYEKDDVMMRAFGPLKEAENFNLIVVPFVPTAENFAVSIWDTLWTSLPDGYEMKRVEVWETPTSCAIYEGEKWDA